MTQIKKYNKKDGSTAYSFNLYVGRSPRTGKNVYRKRQGFKTKKQAQIALADLIKDVDQNGVDPKDSGIETFNDLYDSWVKQQRTKVKPSTMIMDKNVAEKHILPFLGSYKLSAIRVIDCQNLVNEWYEKGYKSYKLYRTLTGQILRYGEAMELISSNPMAKTLLPRKKEEKEKLKYYTKEQLEHFFDCLKDNGDYKKFAYFRLLAFTGCRKSEILALQWKDIDFQKKTVSITKTVAFDEKNNAVLQSPKTGSSVRSISLDDETLTILKKWHIMQRTDYLSRGYNTSGNEQLLFTNRYNAIQAPNSVTQWLSGLVKKYDLPKITPHHFRHTHASLLLQAGVPVKEVSERLGHKDISITLEIYSHVMPEEKEKTASKFANFVGF